ncbi:hypothetical protein SRB5_55370 [Streptomyces sp. RB5]|uniref:GtrA/DPMS transmembrane domain-containing protein n=1 Tax=Streptomyces smaragdinus TaxID=2585196 RepID=A0A7K0CPF5_9ACTN|nr:GtrA family protein [Streptomyces smaragdinus]MQY15358.1 hypothetical protein [Streptomyces smaragdinus]
MSSSVRTTLASFARFVACGGSVGLASSGALILLSGPVPLAVANAIITVVSTVLASELHARLTFRSDRRGWRMHTQSAGTAAVSWAFTTVAMYVLYMFRADPSVLTEQTVYLTASALAGVARFAALKLVVFRPATPVTRTTHLPVSLTKSALTVAA